MSELVATDTTDITELRCDPLERRLEALRSAGAPHVDPVRFRYIELMSRRLASAQESVREQLLTKLERAMTDCEERVREHGRGPELRAAVVPESTVMSRDVDSQGTSTSAPAPLVELNRYIVTATQGDVHPEDYDLSAPAWESSGGLRNARRFRDGWQRHRMEDALGLAVERAPESAGPLNSHRLVLRAMTLMQDLSPLYLQHFVEHAETLLWLDRATARFRKAAATPKTKQPRGAKHPRS